MTYNTVRAAVTLLFGASLLLAGCKDSSHPKADPTPSSTPSVGREYGETLHGAITQAQGAKRTLENSGRVLDQAGGSEE
ncbi:MAG: hypothetical protein AB7P69_27650 [Candidatus Binatia bacterium]